MKLMQEGPSNPHLRAVCVIEIGMRWEQKKTILRRDSHSTTYLMLATCGGRVSLWSWFEKKFAQPGKRQEISDSL
jgi:hypothetical protein